MKSEEIIPSAARLMNSLRDLGYEFNNAVADLIDNSVSHGASKVTITIRFDGLHSWIRIADDGDGMSGSRISEAMRLGTARDYDDSDLGKFGLGLKTASLSQCRILTVASRTDPNRRSLEVRRLDLNHVTRTDRWDILHLSSAERPEALTQPLMDTTGTVVMWEELDRVVSLNDPWGSWAQKRLLRLADELDLHLGMVFGRFISGTTRRRRKRLQITINGTTVEPWDPFVRAEPKCEALQEQQFPIGKGLVRFTPFVLPAQREFSNDDTWRRASGPNNWNRQQGFYIYRADRMIQSGGWSRLRTQDEHTKLARAALDFWPDLDEIFEINISKMRVRLPDTLREQLAGPIQALIRRAQERYRGSDRSGPTRPGRMPAATPTRGAPGAADTGRATPPRPPSVGDDDRQPWTAPAAGAVDRRTSDPATGNGSATTGGTRDTPAAGMGTLSSTGAALQRAARRAGQDEALEHIRAELRRSEAEAADDLGW